jgi:Kef-type K+ transport system membrane component KefB
MTPLSLFTQIGLLILLATLVALALKTIKLPPLLAYLLTGVIAGPWGLNLISEQQLLLGLSSFGIAFLLFLVGLELDLKKLKSLGKTVPLIGIGQMALTAGLGYLIVRLFGINNLASWYMALALAFSSTIIVVKLLTEQNELDSLAGRIAMSMLLMQDAVAIFALITLSSLGSTSNLLIWHITWAVGKGMLLIVTVYFLSYYVLPKLFNFLARSAELLFLTSLAWCFAMAMFSSWLGFSIEIGAFLAGLALASLPYNFEISARIKSLRDFFITLFFIALGSQLSLSGFGSLQPLFWTLIVFVLIGNPLIVFILMWLLGYRKRLSFLVGLTMGMISEFSLILAGMGLKLGHLTPEQVALITGVGVVTITISSFIITHAESLYQIVARYLTPFERHDIQDELTNLPNNLTNHVILIGYHRLGEKLATTLNELGKTTLIVDFNPSVIRRLVADKKPCLYGDMGDIEILQRANIEKAEMVISTNSNLADNLMIVKNIRQQDLRTPLYLTADTWHDCRELYAAGADYVIFPHYLSSQHFSLLLQEMALNKNRVLVDKNKHLKELELHYANRNNH